MGYSKPTFTTLSDKGHDIKRDYELDSRSTIDYYCLLCQPNKKIRRNSFHSHLEKVTKENKK